MPRQTNSLKALIIALIASIPFASCAAPIAGNGKPKTERRELPSFSAIELSGSGELRVKRGGQGVSVTLDSNLLPYVETKVSGGTLYIGMKPGAFIVRADKLLVEVTMPELEGIALSGSGDARVAAFSGQRLSASLSGSGSLEADIAYRELELRVTGSGDCRLTGSADRAEISLSGSGGLEADIDYDELELVASGSGWARLSGEAERGDFSISGSGGLRAEGLRLERASVKLGGSGSAELRVAKELDVSASGSGGVRYYGSPTINQRLSGSGSIRRAGD